MSGQRKKSERDVWITEERQESKQQTGTIGDLFVRDQNPTSDFCIKAKGSNKTSEISLTAHCPRFNLFGQREEMGCFILM